MTSPAHGTAILNANGSVTYTPAPGFTGTDSFTYTVSDGLLTATATVSMTVGVATRWPILDDATVVGGQRRHTIQRAGKRHGYRRR